MAGKTPSHLNNWPFTMGLSVRRWVFSVLFSQGSYFIVKQFHVDLTDPARAAARDPKSKGPKGYKIRLTKVAEINPM
jgi:hypothetical protein